MLFSPYLGDIIIERWIPYGPQPARRTIIEHAPPAIQYPQPSNTTIIYSAVETLRAQKFEKPGVIQEDPATYVARQEPSLSDPATLVQQARNAGVVEDIVNFFEKQNTLRKKNYINLLL